MTFAQTQLKEAIEVSICFNETSVTRKISNEIQKNKSEYATLYPRLYSSSSASRNQFLDTVLVGAMLFDLTRPIHQDEVEQHLFILKKICGLFKIDSLAQLPEEEARKYLTCLSHFITVINKQNPELRWSNSFTNEEIITTLSRLILDKARIGEQLTLEYVARNSTKSKLETYLKHAFQATTTVDALQKSKQGGLLSWFYSSSAIDVARSNAAQFIAKIATSIQTDLMSAEEVSGLSIKDTLTLQNVLIGAILFELNHLAQKFPKEYEKTTSCPIARGLFDALAITSVTELDDNKLSLCLNALSDYVQQRPTTQWHKLLTNNQIREEIQQRQWDVLGAATVQSLTTSA